MKKNVTLILIISLSILFACYGMLLKENGFAAPKGADGAEPIAISMIALREGVFPWSEIPDYLLQQPSVSLSENALAPVSADRVSLPAVSGDSLAEHTEASGKKNAHKGYGHPLIKPDKQKAKLSENSLKRGEERSPENTKGGTVSTPVISRDTQFADVTEDYFADAVFIGDSRFVGVHDYAGLDAADYFCKVSMNIYKLMDTNPETDRDVSSVREGLSRKQYKKIYIMTGLNEIGTGDAAYFTDHYKAVLDEIRTLQPSAVIYVNSIMHVSAELSERDAYCNNPNINARNEALRQMAAEWGAVYLDVNPVYDDASGSLPKEYTVDDVHLKAKYYEPWRNFFLSHAVITP